MKDEVPIEITERACSWLDLLSCDEVNEELRTQFVDWIHRSPAHVTEFLKASALHAELSARMAGDQPWLDDLIEEGSQDVVQMPFSLENRASDRASKQHPGFKKSLVAIAVSLVVALSITVWMRAYSDSTRITTLVGEMRILVLDDGSNLELNTDSAVRVNFDASMRRIELIRGELLVNVVEDASRPFVVTADKVAVTAIGTQFNVYRKDEATEVTVIEGRVMVDWSAGADSNRQLELNAGSKAVVTENAANLVPGQANVESVIAWSERRLSFEDTTVAEVAAELNRYNRSRVLIDDPLLSRRRITGVFDVNDPDAFISLLQRLEKIDVQLSDSGHRHVKTTTTNK